MTLWTSADAVAATGGETSCDWAVNGISIDTRTLQPGDLFVALTAARDGHDFVAQALEKGAGAALVSRIPEGVAPDAPLLLVEDVQLGLEALGRAGRARSSSSSRGRAGRSRAAGTACTTSSRRSRSPSSSSPPHPSRPASRPRQTPLIEHNTDQSRKSKRRNGARYRAAR